VEGVPPALAVPPTAGMGVVAAVPAASPMGEPAGADVQPTSVADQQLAALSTQAMRFIGVIAV